MPHSVRCHDAAELSISPTTYQDRPAGESQERHEHEPHDDTSPQSSPRTLVRRRSARRERVAPKTVARHRHQRATIPKPSVALCSAKPIISSTANDTGSPQAAELANGQPLAEVVQSDPDRDGHAQAQALAADRVVVGLGHRHRARANAERRSAVAPARDVEQAHQAHAKPMMSAAPSMLSWPPRSRPLMAASERFGGMGEDVDEQEDEHARGQTAEEDAHAPPARRESAERQPEKDR